MLLRTALAGCLAMLALPTPDSWMPFENQRVVSPSGRRYVVVKEAGRKITFELCERAAGAAAMTPARVSVIAKPGATVDRDPADKVLASGNWNQLPLEVEVPDQPGGFLLFDQYARVGFGKTVTWIDDSGAEKLSLTLVQIFGAVPAQATPTVSSLWWSQGYWIDAARGSIVVVAVGDELREIKIADGTGSTPGVPELTAWAAGGDPRGRLLALEVLSRKPAIELKDALPSVMAIVHDAQQPIDVRLRASVCAKAGGAPVACATLFATAMAPAQPSAVRRYAVSQLPTVLGEQAMPILRERMRGVATDEWGDAYQAFVKLGEAAVPTLIEMLGEAGQSSDYRGGAAHALAEIRSPKAMAALLQAVATADDYVANAACNAAIATGAADLTQRLIAILQAGSTQDGRIALYLAKHPEPAALPAIEAALLRCKADTNRRWLEEARAACQK